LDADPERLVNRSLSASLRKFSQRFVAALVICVTLSIGGIAGAYWFANDKWDHNVHNAAIDQDVFASAKAGKPANFLIVGSDTRAFVKTQTDKEHFGTASQEGGQRSDTIMVAHIDPTSNTGMIVSFPRDLIVDVPGIGRTRINAAFNHGPQRVIETIKQNFDIPIHHYLELDFAGFQELVNAVGTVPIYFTTIARDTYTGLNIPAPGCYHLDGAQALAYVRSRHYQYKLTAGGSWHDDPYSDLGRIKRQQYFIRSLAAVAIPTAVKHPLKANNILDKAFASIVKDKGLSLSDVRGLVATLRTADPARVPMLTIPTTTNSDGATLSLDSAKAAPVLAALRSFSAPNASTTTPTAPKNVAPGTVRVKVLNGSGVSGKARATLSALGAAGFQEVQPPADADRIDYATTEVRYGAGAKAKAQLVAAYLGVGKLVEGGNVSGSDVTVVIGRDFTHVRTPGATTTTAAAATTTTAPSGPKANPAQAAGAAAQPLVGC
jgi:LCP family protein required for cell wall assembly